MIPLLLASLIGGATFLALHRMAADTVVALGAAIFAAVLFEAIRDTLRNRHDRLVARLRWHEMADNDVERAELRNEAALRRILRG